MEMLNCNEAALLLGISSRRIQQMCKDGKIVGAKKVNRIWMIPKSSINANSTLNCNLRLPLPIGISDFKEAVSKYYYVDKTLLIRDVIDSMTKVTLFTRPRRFGKTLTMDMLRVFFEKTNNDTSVFFKDKNIWKCGEKYTKYQGQYPTIFLTFKDVKCETWDETYEKIKKLVAIEFQRHQELLNGDKLNDYDKQQYLNFSTEKASQIEYQMSLQILTMLLYKYYGKPCVVIIDEYDTPIQQGFSKSFYEDIVNFMRNFFSGGLKDNSYLEFGFLTGILRVAKESIFSGLNNIKIYSVLDNKFSSFFGFTKEEVAEILKSYNVSNKYNEVCEWYNGYQFGNSEIINPWSVLNYIEDNCFPKAFWQSTGSNDIIGEIISNVESDTIENLYTLLMGNKITTYIDTNIVYSEIYNSSYSIFSFLLLAGYLTVVKNYPQNDGNYMCDLQIPNKEICFIYEKEILSKIGKESIAISFQQAIFNKDIKKLQKSIERFLLESVSTFDGKNESFYHGMLLGLCAIVGNRYKVSSNIESGYGRFDIELCPTDKNNPAFIFELKYVKNDKDLDIMSEKELEQIIEKKYDTSLNLNGIKNIYKIGIAFCGKKFVIKSKIETK